jgi:cell division septation protein DedD
MHLKHLVAAALIAAAASPVAAQSVKAGIEAWQQADYSRAIAIWRPLAEKGDADASFNLGQAYRLGRGVPLNLAAAKIWFERAANKGHLDAQATLGLLLFDNGDRAGGLKWLKIAADRGEPRALLVYGTALFNGDAVKQDRVLAYALVSRAAAQGLAPAQETLAQLDALMPLDQRKKGAALAIAKAKSAPPPSSKSVAKPKPAAPQKAAKAAPPSQAATAPAAVAASGGWRIQLGAFSQRASAETLFRKLSGALAGRQPFYVAAGPVIRLQVGPYPSRAAALAACASLSARGQACFPVAAR